ncbi:hypothetical protein E2C01_037914 [Portunus trituberculatus]|uniref:Uncharacterized protein n=1 Tax=Portunus trituberculatus TaxID=210409 RepID=A0A5B7FFC5_PORTR|nr:hypothetical protein [Portunus trituberculatus]
MHQVDVHPYVHQDHVRNEKATLTWPVTNTSHQHTSEQYNKCIVPHLPSQAVPIAGLQKISGEIILSLNVHHSFFSSGSPIVSTWLANMAFPVCGKATVQRGKGASSPARPECQPSCTALTLTHEVGESLGVFLVDAQVVDGDADGYDANGHAELDRPLDDGQHHQEEADDEEEDGEADPHLDGAGAVRVTVAQPQQGGDGHQDEERLSEGDVVDEHLHVRRDQHEQRHQPLSGHQGREGVRLSQGKTSGVCVTLLHHQLMSHVCSD